MNKFFLLLILLCLVSVLQAQASKIVNVTAGGLSAALTTTERSTITDLTITGIIDARDFKTMRDEMPELAYLDIKKQPFRLFPEQI